MDDINSKNEMLQRIKDIKFESAYINIDVLTIEMAANLLKVPIEVINKIISEHTEVLKEEGLLIIKGIKKSSFEYRYNLEEKGDKLILLPNNAVLRVGLLLNIVPEDMVVIDAKFLKITIESKVLTIQKAAKFYEVSPDNIFRVIQRHPIFFQHIGVTNITGNSLSCFKRNNWIQSNAPSFTLLPNDAILRIAFFLSPKSSVSRKVREIIRNSNIDGLKRLLELSGSTNYLTKQKIVDKTLVTTFNGICNIKREVACGQYRIDYVLNNNIAVECNEFNHKNRSSKKELEKVNFIKKAGYHLFCINPDSSNQYEIFSMIREIFKLLYFSSK